jgi:hypothetical protein
MLRVINIVLESILFVFRVMLLCGLLVSNVGLASPIANLYDQRVLVASHINLQWDWPNPHLTQANHTIASHEKQTK